MVSLSIITKTGFAIILKREVRQEGAPTLLTKTMMGHVITGVRWAEVMEEGMVADKATTIAMARVKDKEIAVDAGKVVTEVTSSNPPPLTASKISILVQLKEEKLQKSSS